MKYINQKDIYKNIKKGMIIKYYNCSPTSKNKHNKINIGIVNSIASCNRCSQEAGCNIYIGVDGNKPNCFMYGGKTAIIEIDDTTFLNISDFEV